MAVIQKAILDNKKAFRRLPLVTDAVAATNPSYYTAVADLEDANPEQLKSVTDAAARYDILSGSPVVTYDVSNPHAPVLQVTGGTIKLKELWVRYSAGGSSQDPVWTLNGTVSASLLLSTPKVTKVIRNSDTPGSATYNQQDIDNTPQVRFFDYAASSMKVQLAAVTGDWLVNFHFSMNE